MANRTEQRDGITVSIDDEDRGPDGNAPVVRVSIEVNGQPLSNWDAVPEWDGRVPELTDDEIFEHPTVQRMAAARPHP